MVKTMPISLYHYTNSRGFRSIQSTNLMLPSGLGRRGFATHGSGQYFSDLPPTGLLSRIEYSYALFNSPRVQHKVKNWLLIDVSHLPVKKVQDIYTNRITSSRKAAVSHFGIYLIERSTPLMVHIINQGQTLFHLGS